MTPTTQDVVLTIDVDTTAAQARLEQLLDQMAQLDFQRALHQAYRRRQLARRRRNRS